MLILQLNSSSCCTSGRTESLAVPSLVSPQGIPTSRVVLRGCILLGCSFEGKGVSCHGESGFLALSGWRQGSRTALWPSEMTTSCCWIQYLASPQGWTSISPRARIWWCCDPGDQDLLSCSPSLFLKLVSLCGGVGPLFQKIQVLTLPKLYCPSKREPTSTLDRCCSALQGRSVFLLLPLWAWLFTCC